MSIEAYLGFRSQTGVSLVIALILLLVLTIIGIASMNTSLMQERMAGNVNLQTLAFEAASVGVTEAAEFGLNRNNWPYLDEENGIRKDCRPRQIGWNEPTGWTEPTLVEIPGLPDDLFLEFRQRVGCFNPDPVDIPSDWDGDYKVPAQLLVLNQGIVRRGDGDVLAMREIEVRVENRGVSDTQCAIRIEGGIDETQLRVPNSNLGVDGGEGGCPVSVSEKEGADLLKDEVEAAGRIGQYTPTDPGISSPEEEGSLPWGQPQAFAEFMNDIKTAVLAYDDFKRSELNEADWLTDLLARVDAVNDADAAYGRLNRIRDFVYPEAPEERRSVGWSIEKCKSKFVEGNNKISNANIPQGQCPINFGTAPNNQRWPNSEEVGDLEYPELITYVAGHLGNPSNNSGSGILITEGGVCWSGTANFNGLQIIGGGHYEIIGGGGAETTGGILMSSLGNRYNDSSDSPDFHALRGTAGEPGELTNLLPYETPSSAVFGNSGLRFAGGGSHTITFKCSNENDPAGAPGFKQYIDRLNECLDPDVRIEPNCDPDETGLGFRQAIASWREYIDRVRWE